MYMYAWLCGTVHGAVLCTLFTTAMTFFIGHVHVHDCVHVHVTHDTCVHVHVVLLCTTGMCVLIVIVCLFVV